VHGLSFKGYFCTKFSLWNLESQGMRDVVRQLIQALEQEREPIVCQVVETRGSTPQKAGALMIVDPTGGQAGTLGGGCVENEVKQKAIQQIGETDAALHTFVLDHDYAWADGLICGGKMVILSQPMRGPAPLAYFRMIDKVIEEREGFTEAIVVDPEQVGGTALGARFLLDGSGRLRASLPGGVVPQSLISQLNSPGDRPRPKVHGGVAFLPTWPRIRLVIVGAGHVGQAVANLAAQADFDVWVVDDRQQYANRDRLPAAQRILVGPIEDVLASLEINPQTYVLIVTRGHGHDQEALYHLAPTSASYVGLIGSRRKIRLIYDNLRDAGISETDLQRVAAPVGLEIGSQTVPEIAISIVAELIARRNLGPEGIAPRAHNEFLASATVGTRPGAGSATAP
jgi:xanthine dehydrogenase accessory factor